MRVWWFIFAGLLATPILTACGNDDCTRTATCVASGGGGAGAGAGTMQVGGEGGLGTGGNAGGQGGGGSAGVCGDGMLDAGENCDDGDENMLALGACAPDCSRIIVQKMVEGSLGFSGADFGTNPVAFADAACQVGYKALFSSGNARRATTTPFEVVDPIDWVVQPYTYYYIGTDWFLTDHVALIGVRDGQLVGVESSLQFQPMVTGLAADYTTLQSSNCNGWASASSGDVMRHGDIGRTDARFLDSSPNTIPCDTYVQVYCIEQ